MSTLAYDIHLDVKTLSKIKIQDAFAEYSICCKLLTSRSSCKYYCFLLLPLMTMRITFLALLTRFPLDVANEKAEKLQLFAFWSMLLPILYVLPINYCLLMRVTTWNLSKSFYMYGSIFHVSGIFVFLLNVKLNHAARGKNLPKNAKVDENNKRYIQMNSKKHLFHNAYYPFQDLHQKRKRKFPMLLILAIILHLIGAAGMVYKFEANAAEDITTNGDVFTKVLPIQCATIGIMSVIYVGLYGPFIRPESTYVIEVESAHKKGRLEIVKSKLHSLTSMISNLNA